MRFLFLLMFSLLSNLAFSQTNITETLDLKKETIIGEWVIDLRPTPDAPPYYQSLKISEVDQKNFVGTFYGSPIKDALLNENWGKLYFAFKTSDQNNTYFQSGYINGDELIGVSYCPTRNFVIPWKGKRKK